MCILQVLRGKLQHSKQGPKIAEIGQFKIFFTFKWSASMFNALFQYVMSKKVNFHAK